jgi:hypothetical protein
MFINPFKPKAAISLAVPENALPGAQVPVDINLVAHEQINARGVRLELVGRETYYVKHTHTDKNGTHTTIVKKEEAFSRTEQYVSERPVLVPGAEQRWKGTVNVPPNAPPTCKGKLVDIEWTVKSVLDVQNRPDQLHESTLKVFRLPVTSFVPVETARIHQFSDLSMRLEVPRVLADRDVLIGSLQIETKKAFSLRSIRVELVRQEEAGVRKSEEAEVTQSIAGATSFSAFDSPSFDFSLTVPENAPPSMTSPHSHLRWVLKATLDRQMRKDFNIEEEILLYNAPEPAK